MSVEEATTAVVDVEVEGATVVEVVGAELGRVGVVWALQATRIRATGRTRVTLERVSARLRYIDADSTTR